MTTKLAALNAWVAEVATQTQPDAIHWCDGSDAEYAAMIEKMLADGTMSTLNQESHPNCYLHLSDPSDVARVEHLTFVCTGDQEDAGPNNNWMSPQEGHEKEGHAEARQEALTPTGWVSTIPAAGSAVGWVGSVNI